MLISSAVATHKRGVTIYRGPDLPHWTCAHLIEGELVLTGNSKRYTIRAPSFFLIPAHIEYEFVVTVPDVHYWCIFALDTDLSVVLNESRDVEVIELDPSKAIHIGIATSIKEALDWWNLTPPRLALANNALAKALLLSVEEKSMKLHSRDKRIALAVAYIQKNIRTNLQVTDLAKRVNLSPSRFATLFKQQMNMTPARCIEAKRLELAADLLLDSCRRISEIADTVGYKNAFHFSRRFHAVYGQSPREFRRKPERRRFEIVPSVPSAQV